MDALRIQPGRGTQDREGLLEPPPHDSRRAALAGFFLLVLAAICLVYGLVNLFHMGDAVLATFELGVLVVVMAAWLDLKRHGHVERASWVTVLASGALAVFFYWHVQAEVASAVWVMFFAMINFFLLATRHAVAVYLVYSTAIVALVLANRADWPAVQPVEALYNVVGALAAFGIAAFFQERYRQEAQDKVLTLANRDFLTGIWNRRHFIEQVEAFRQVHRTSSRKYAFILADIDHFKRINDTHGHAVGDEVLKAVAQRIESAVRRGDMVGRLGGEEFGVLLIDCDATDARHRAERIRAVVADGPIATASQRVPITLSLGVSGGEVAGQDFNELFARADERLYMAKGRGRNRVVAGTGDTAG